MLAQVTNAATALDSIATGLHYYLPSVSVENLVLALLAVSKFAQLAYKHWTKEGTKLDTLMKVVGVVQDTTPIVNVTSTGTASGNGPK